MKIKIGLLRGDVYSINLSTSYRFYLTRKQINMNILFKHDWKIPRDKIEEKNNVKDDMKVIVNLGLQLCYLKGN